MLTLKQLDALRWIAALGSFERAAKHLNTTQSAISKRIQELEAVLGEAVFDRSQRGARLTLKGEEVLTVGESMLEMRDRLLTASHGPKRQIRRLSFGVTELTALTWLPDFVAGIRQYFQGTSLEPEVEQSADLLARLDHGTVDFIVVPDVFRRPKFRTVSLASVENVWMSSPRLMPARHIMPMGELSRFPVLLQGDRSGSGLMYERWMHEQGIRFERYVRSNSLIALVGLTISAVGISYLPRQCFNKLLDRDDLRIVHTDPALPPVTYVVMFRDNASSELVEMITHLARRSCNFSIPTQWH